MKLDEFISNVLQDIDTGLQEALKKTDRHYFVKTGNDSADGVNFDIAVTTTRSSGSKAEGTAKAGFIQVLGAGVGAELEDKNENSQVSRIQFSVYVPTQTKTESAEELMQIRAKNQNDW